MNKKLQLKGVISHYVHKKPKNQRPPTTKIMSILAAMQFILDNEATLKGTPFEHSGKNYELTKLLQYFERCANQLEWSEAAATVADQYVLATEIFESWHQILFELTTMPLDKVEEFQKDFEGLLDKYQRYTRPYDGKKANYKQVERKEVIRNDRNIVMHATVDGGVDYSVERPDTILP